MGKHSLTSYLDIYLNVKNFIFDEKNKNISTKFILLMILSLAGCSSIDLDGNEDSLYSAPIKTSENREKLSNDDDNKVNNSSIISSQNLTPKTIPKVSLENYGDFEPAVYFDYDQFNVKSVYIDIIKKIAQVMREDLKLNVMLEGHSDERGTREYNVALGHKRAESVAKALEAEGIDRKRMDTVSFGEEDPEDNTQNEDGWAKNRRCDLILKRGIQ
tara:strand:+ start:285 stop:932 length:648 start_codon:yes stop_codon:yes gene_type:complete